MGSGHILITVHHRALHYIQVALVLQCTYTPTLVGNFRGRKLSQFGRNKIFTENIFADCTLVSLPKDALPPNFVEKTFTNSYKTSKFAKVFSFESFPLYGIWDNGFMSCSSIHRPEKALDQ